MPVLDQLSMYLIYGIATGIVTVAATVLLIVPYVCLRGVNALRQRPWLIYVESGAITIFASVVLTHFVKPTAKTFLHTFYPYVVFALATSIASSAFYMSKVKAISAQLTTVD